jgi:hypothetical protein
MSKELNIIEAMKMPVDTEFKIKYADGRYSTKNIILKESRKEKKYLDWVNDGGLKVYEFLITETIFIPIQQPVSYADAIDAGVNGKRIKVDVTELNKKYGECVLNKWWNDTYKEPKEIFLMLGNSNERNVQRIIKEGKWYIEESEEE